MTNGQFMEILAKRAHKYALEAKASLQRNYHMHDLDAEQLSSVSDDVVKAILNDYINYVGVHQCGMDYAMNTSDFPEQST